MVAGCRQKKKNRRSNAPQAPGSKGKRSSFQEYGCDGHGRYACLPGYHFVCCQAYRWPVNGMMEKVLLIAPDVHIESNTWLMGELFQTYIYAVMPVMVMAILVGVFVSMIQTGGVFSFFSVKTRH